MIMKRCQMLHSYFYIINLSSHNRVYMYPPSLVCLQTEDSGYVQTLINCFCFFLFWDYVIFEKYSWQLWIGLVGGDLWPSLRLPVPTLITPSCHSQIIPYFIPAQPYYLHFWTHFLAINKTLRQANNGQWKMKCFCQHHCLSKI